LVSEQLRPVLQYLCQFMILPAAGEGMVPVERFMFTASVLRFQCRLSIFSCRLSWS
ncbi:hypothetical protein T12_12153, partial [Trichinella patagoniensis]